MKYLIHYIEEEQTQLFKEKDAFFAFGNKQFEEKKQPGIKYVNMGIGLICPKNNVKELIEGLDTIYKRGIMQDVAENGAKGIIKREFFNHETQLTGDTTAATKAIQGHIEMYPNLFTHEAMKVAFKEAMDTAIEQNLF